MTQRIRERVEGLHDEETAYALRQMRDEDEVDPLSRVPKCCVGRSSAPTIEELMKKHPLKPAKERNMSRARQKHGYKDE